MEARTAIVKVALANGATLLIEAAALGGEEEVAFTLPQFQAVMDAIEGIADSVVTTLQKKPGSRKRFGRKSDPHYDCIERLSRIERPATNISPPGFTLDEWSHERK